MYPKNRSFPLVSDEELVVGELPQQMKLYENEDLINNIRGDYKDKDYDDVTQGYQFVSNEEKPAKERVEAVNAGRVYAEVLRETTRREARERHLEAIGKKSKEPFKPSARMTSKPQLPQNELTRFSTRLSQDDLILAEIKPIYQQPKNQKTKSGKNNYDFLKKSQVYHQGDNSTNRERQLELNLTGLEAIN